jgi:hypothetical protein
MRPRRTITAWNVVAAMLGVAMSWLGVLAKLKAPETPCYLSEPPTIEGEG